MRLDVKDISTSSMYVTIWASIFLTCHFSKIQKAKDIFEKHVGVRLQVSQFSPCHHFCITQRMYNRIKCKWKHWEASLAIALEGVAFNIDP